MSDHRYVVTVTDEEGRFHVFGPYRSLDRAEAECERVNAAFERHQAIDFGDLFREAQVLVLEPGGAIRVGDLVTSVAGIQRELDAKFS